MAEAEGTALSGTEVPKAQARPGTEAPPSRETGKIAAPKTEKAAEGTTGQPGEGKAAGKTGKETAGTQQATEEPTFFDPKTLDPALLPAYKEMQRAFGKKMEALSKDRSKIEAYDAFGKDPIGNLQRMAGQMGFRLTRADAAAALASQEAGGQTGEWEPKTWGEVIDRITQATQERLMKNLSPVLNQVTEMRKMNIEKMLDDSCPDWRQYEDEMTRNVQAHPSLVNDPVTLYRISVPSEVLESRATQAALKKLEGKVKGSQGGGGPSTTTKHQVVTFEKPLSFNEAVQAAKARMAEQGIVKPPGA